MLGKLVGELALLLFKLLVYNLLQLCNSLLCFRQLQSLNTEQAVVKMQGSCGSCRTLCRASCSGCSRCRFSTSLSALFGMAEMWNRCQAINSMLLQLGLLRMHQLGLVAEATGHLGHVLWLHEAFPDAQGLGIQNVLRWHSTFLLLLAPQQDVLREFNVVAKRRLKFFFVQQAILHAFIARNAMDD